MGVSTVKLNGTTIMTVNDTTATASDVAQSKYFYAADGVKTAGTASGGGGSTADPNDVTFYDYDGTVVASYTAADFANLSAMPSNPSHTGLTAQGWNWTLAKAKTYVATYGKLNIGQMYITDDGKTRLYIEIPDGATGDQLTFYVRYTQSIANGVTVDWGDGNSETFTGTSAANRAHTYASTGKYLITLAVTSGTVSFVGSSSYGIYGAISNYYNRARIYKAEIGSNVTSIGNYAFLSCYALTSITIPSSVTSIGTNIFQNCYALTSTTIPNDVTSIGGNAFYYCYALASITIPNGVTSIGNNAFSNCYVLTSITIPDSVTSIGTNIFQYCYALTSITIPNRVTSIGGNAFYYCYALASTTIHNGVTSIGSNAFYNCYVLTSITIPSSVTSIGSNAFYNCYALASITIPSSVTSIENYAFYYCCALTSIIIPNDVTSIGNYAFSNCYALTSITIPEDVTSIGSNAITNCYNASYVKLLSTTPPTLGTSNFANMTKCIIYVPYSADHSVLAAYQTASNWSSFASQMVEMPAS